MTQIFSGKYPPIQFDIDAQLNVTETPLPMPGAALGGRGS